MSWFTLLLVLALAWFLAPVFAAIFAVLAIIFVPAFLAGIVASAIPQIPFGAAYFGVLLFVIVCAWKDRPGRKVSAYLAHSSSPLAQATAKLNLTAKERRSRPTEELDFIDGCQAIVQGCDEEAFMHLRKAVHLADGAFLAGVLALKMDRPAEAGEYLSSITERERELDRYISKAGITVTVRLPISEEVSTMVDPDMRGVLLALSQAYVKQKRWQDGLVHLLRLRHLEPYDTAARLVMVEWLLQARPGDRESCEEIIRLTEGQSCDSAFEAALLLDRARALKNLGRLREAWNALDKVLCSSKVRHPELLEAVCREKNILEESTQMPDRPGHGVDGSCREEMDAT